MAVKKEARELQNNTGNGKASGKNTKRDRITHYELVYKRQSPLKVINMERNSI